MIQIQNVSKIYKTKERVVTGVDNVSLDINTGEIFGIVGYSGAGKSSLIRCLNLLEKPTSGTILVDGLNLMKSKGEQSPSGTFENRNDFSALLFNQPKDRI